MKNLIVILLCFLLSAAIYSQEKRVALVMGNSNYENGAPLANPEYDAEDIGKKLEEAGFDVSRYLDLSQTEMKKVIDEFGLKLEEADIGLFFYAGHGVQAKGKNYLIPIDAQLKTENDVEYNCVDAGRILAKMEDANTSTNIVILDACRNNPFERSWSRNSNGNGLAYMNAPGGSIIAYSTAPGKTASDGYNRNSPFTSGLLEYIGTPNLNVEALFKLVRIKVMENTKGQQIPWESTSLTGDFYFNADQDKAQTRISDILPEQEEIVMKYTDYESRRQTLAAGIRSIAVMPISNYTGDESKNYITYGIQDALISELGQLGSIKVISTSSTLPYADFQKTIKDIANELNVDGIIEASLLGAEEKLGFNIKLYSALPEEELIWTKSYKSDIQNIFRLYTEVVKNIADEIQLSLSEGKRKELLKERTVVPEAYKAYLQGKFHMSMLSQEGIQSALEYYNKAIEIDPEYGIAYAGIAGVWAFLKQMDFVSVEMANPFIRENIKKALQYDGQSEEFYYWSGVISVWTDFDWEAGEIAFKKCLEINPNHAESWAYYSHLLMFLRRNTEMREAMSKAVELDPDDFLIQVLAGVTYLFDREFERTIEHMKPLQEMMPTNPLIIMVLAQAYAETQQYDLATLEFGKLLGHLKDQTPVTILHKVYGESGFESAMNAFALALENGDEFVSPQHIYLIYAYANNIEKTLFWLERAFIKKDPGNPYITTGPRMSLVRDEPRYIDLIKALGLPLKEPN